jgi:hypothetical protein
MAGLGLARAGGGVGGGDGVGGSRAGSLRLGAAAARLPAPLGGLAAQGVEARVGPKLADFPKDVHRGHHDTASRDFPRDTSQGGHGFFVDVPDDMPLYEWHVRRVGCAIFRGARCYVGAGTREQHPAGPSGALAVVVEESHGPSPSWCSGKGICASTYTTLMHRPDCTQIAGNSSIDYVRYFGVSRWTDASCIYVATSPPPPCLPRLGPDQ